MCFIRGGGYRRVFRAPTPTRNQSSMKVTQVCRFINCKLAVQSKLGPQRLSQLGYSNVIFLTPRKNKGHYYTGFGIIKYSRFLGFQETPYKSMQSNIMENLILYFFLKFWEMSAF